MNNVGPKIIALLNGSTTPEQICTQMKMCTASTDAVIDADEVDRHNAEGHSWKATTENQFFGKTIKDIKPLMGLKMGNIDAPIIKHDLIEDSAIPDTFDARTAFKDCIHPIRNQGKCGSCWAVSASEVLSDRFCIHSQGKVNAVLSAEDLVSCDSGDNGCNGGMLPHAWEYMKDTGLVTDKCFPYTAEAGQVEKCVTSCKDGETFTKYKAASYGRLGSVADMKKEIMTNGPIQAGFMVYKSFMSYKSGVYTKKWYEFIPLGAHAIKIVGWGTENGTAYWLVANSWGTTWGEDGFFKIKQGSCMIESQPYAGIPQV